MRFAVPIGLLLSGAVAIEMSGEVQATTQTPFPQPVEHSRLESRVLLAQRVACRRIVAEGITPFYTSFPREGAQYGVLQSGDRVGIYTGEQPERGAYGQSYLYVTSPYGSSNAAGGYIPTQYQARDGSFRSTLGTCEGRRARW